MGNEMIITTTKINTGSIVLDKDINKINTEINNGNRASHEIARTLNKIKVEENWKVTGYDSFSDFAEGFFKISKSQASRLCAVAQKFLNTPKYETYKISQLTEMIHADDKMLEYIQPTMTSKEIRDYINGAKQIEDKTKKPTEDKLTEDKPIDDKSTEDKPTEETTTEQAKNEVNTEFGYINTDTTISEEYVYEEITKGDGYEVSKNKIGTYHADCSDISALNRLVAYIKKHNPKATAIRVTFEELPEQENEQETLENNG